jgi:rhamnulose-1-phosphate aldolase
MAAATIQQLETHDVVLEKKHGALVLGDDLSKCFDLSDTLTKSACIQLSARTAGFEPQWLSRKQMNGLAKAFGHPKAF